MKLYELSEIKFKNIFVDGTKIEANANRYTFVWRKAIEKNNEKLNQKAESILPVICERYGINEYVSIEECYDTLSKQAMLFDEQFVYGKGHHKTQLQRDIEALGASKMKIPSCRYAQEGIKLTYHFSTYMTICVSCNGEIPSTIT